MTAEPVVRQANSELLRLATAGSVDDGKSTLIGRLLYDTKAIFEDQLAQISLASERRHGEAGTGSGSVPDLALLTDGLRAEREQGITIDVAYRYFTTPQRSFIIADTPGHVRYTRNMVTGASTADVALVLVDARHGVVEQSRRHAFIASLLRIPHLIVAVNKMDLVDWDKAAFDSVVDAFTDFSVKLDVSDVTFIPISALHGDNVVDRSLVSTWYDGPTLLHHLEHVHIASDRNFRDVRFPVQWVVRPGTDEHRDYRGYAGQVAGGILRPGDEVVVLPSGARSCIAGIDTFDGPVDEAFPPMSVTIRLTDELDVSRGDVIARPQNRPQLERRVDAMLCWMSEAESRATGRYLIKHTTRTTRAVLETIIHRIDVDKLHREEGVDALALNDIARVTLRTSMPLAFDPYSRNRATGSFILIDEATNDTVAAGMLQGPAVSERSDGVTWDEGRLTRERRWDALGLKGATIWMTGLPASGKSTIAAALEKRLIEATIPAYRLDGDNLRHGLNGNLGFSREDRSENARRTAQAARLLADAGLIVVVSLVSPFADDRATARRLHEEEDFNFFEVFIDTPVEECERRDPKGLYARARAGDLPGFTGVTDPYEVPEAPDLVLGPADVDRAVDRAWALLVEHGVLSG